MSAVINVFIESTIQLIGFSLIPFICWLVFRKRIKQSFFHWIGFKKPKITKVKNLVIVLFVCVLLWITIYPLLAPAMQFSATTAYSKNGINASAIICVFLVSFLQTGLSEELLFRGFIGKGAIKILGFMKGNMVQAVIFGLMHSFIYLSGCGLFVTVVLVASAALSSSISCYMNEKVCGGSIIPSWIFHGFSNCVTGFIAFI